MLVICPLVSRPPVLRRPLGVGPLPRESHNLTRTGELKRLVESLNWQLNWFGRDLNAKPPDTQ